MTRGETNIRWIERFCRVPSGMNVGQPVRLRGWQKDNIRKIYDNPSITRRAILSFGRKNGKTALSAWLLLLHLCGPEAIENGELYSAAQTRDQAGILFKLAKQTVLKSPDLINVVDIRDSGKELSCPDLGTTYKALSSDASNALGLSPCFLVHDELGAVRGPKYELYENLETACGAQARPLSIVISTQAPNPSDLLSILIDDALSEADPRTVLSLYSAPDDADPFSIEAIRAANPALGDFQNEAEILATAENARRMPSAEAAFRNLHLNQRVEMNAPFVSRAVWKSCDAQPEPLSGAVYGGLDLSSVSDLTALCYIGWQDDRFHVHPTFWLPAEGLREKASKDRTPFDTWAQQGLIETSPGRSISYEQVAQHIYADCQTMDVRKFFYDPWHWTHIKPWLLKVGFKESQLEGEKAIFQPFRQGFASMRPALNTLESDLLEARIAHGGNPVLSMNAFNAIVTTDAAGNRKLDKSKATGRIDGMIALTMARAAAGTDFSKPKSKTTFFTLSR